MSKPPDDDRGRRDFFVSYTATDRRWAEWISWQLEEAGYTVLLQAWDMVPGSNWLRMMNEATKFAERTIAVLSETYLTKSPFSEAEWLDAYRRDPYGLAGRLIPIRVDACTPDGLLAGIVYADLVGLSEKGAARSRLLEAVRTAVARRSKPLVEPEFPGAGRPGDAPAERAGPGEAEAAGERRLLDTVDLREGKDDAVQQELGVDPVTSARSILSALRRDPGGAAIFPVVALLVGAGIWLSRDNAAGAIAAGLVVGVLAYAAYRLTERVTASLRR